MSTSSAPAVNEGVMDRLSLLSYVETRLQLLDTSITDKVGATDDALRAFAVATRLAADAAKAAMDAAQIAADLRYQQRFEAQSDALAAAFQSQQQAMQTAFTVAEKAVQAALAAADRAVSKAELAADKRFEALNELRQMLNDMVGTMLTRIEALQRFDAVGEKIDSGAKRIATLEERMNLLSGADAGSNKRTADLRAVIAVLIAVAAVAVNVLLFLLRR